MRLSLLFIALLLIPLPAPAQQLPQEIDSLNRLLAAHPQPDTVRLALLNELAYTYYATNPDKGLETAALAEALAQQLHNLNGMAMANSRKGVNYWAKGEYAKAVAASNRALDIYRETGNRLSYAKTLNNRAISHFAMGDYVGALRDHEEALPVFKKLHYEEGVQHSYNNMGTIFLTLNDYPRALQSFLDAQKAGQDAQRPPDPGILSNIGLVYKNWNQYARALEYEKQALDIYRQKGNRRGMALCLSNIASLYDFMEQPQKAIAFYEQSLAINREMGNGEKIAGDLTNLGVVYRDLHKSDTAIRYLQDAIALYREQEDKGNLSIALVALAGAKDSLLRHSANLQEVLHIQQAALQAARESEIPLRESEALEALSHTYERLGKYPEALAAYKQHIALQDTIYNQEKDREITRKQMSFDFEKKEAAAQAEIQKQATIKKASMLAGGGLLLAAMLGFVFYKRRIDALALKRDAEFKALVAETELKALRSQMNPHFIFNSLNSIGDYILKNNTVEAREYLANFARLMRMTLENSNHPEITLAADLQFVEMYLAVEKRRLQQQFSYRIAVADGLDAENILVPPMLLQPFIENAIWHGFRGKTGEGLITIAISEKDGMLLCSVDDNGVGRKQPAVMETGKQSMGIAITRSRLAVLNRQHQSRGRLQIIDKAGGQGTRVEIWLPLILQF